jgi:hypothetical protein
LGMKNVLLPSAEASMNHCEAEPIQKDKGAILKKTNLIIVGCYGKAETPDCIDVSYQTRLSRQRIYQQDTLRAMTLACEIWTIAKRSKPSTGHRRQGD